MGAQKDDVLLLVVGDSNGNIDLSTFSSGFTARRGVCSNENQRHFGFATRADDGQSSSFALTVAPGADAVSAVLIAIGGVGPPYDYTLNNDDVSLNDAGIVGGAQPVNVPTSTGLVVVGFLSDDNGREQGNGSSAGLADLTSVTFFGRGELKLYSGTFQKGKTTTFGPFTSAPACWGALAIAFPAAP